MSFSKRFFEKENNLERLKSEDLFEKQTHNGILLQREGKQLRKSLLLLLDSQDERTNNF